MDDNTQELCLLIPLYSWPFEGPWSSRELSRNWQKIIDLKTLYTNQKIAVIVNPSNGDFDLGSGGLENSVLKNSLPNPEIVKGITMWQDAGIDLIAGYLYTAFGERDQSHLIQRMHPYRLWYPEVNAIFLDEMAHVRADFDQYYRYLQHEAKSRGFLFTFGNAGTATKEQYVGTVDCVIIYENPGLPQIEEIERRTFCGKYSRSNFGVMPYCINSFNSTWIRKVSKHCEFIHLTQAGCNGNPRDSVSSYLDDIILSK